jgi:hypothetical protein
MPACCGCHMGGGGGAAMVSPPRPSRVSFDRSSRDGDGQTIGSRLVNGGTVRRRAPLAVTPGRLNRSPIRVSKTRRLARGTRQWRLGAAVSVPARRLRRMSAAKRLFSGRPEKRFRSARPRARPLMSDRARASSPVARRAHDAASAALTLCISAYVLWVLAVRLPLVRRGRPQASRDPEARFPFSRAAATSRRHARADRVRAPTRCPFANRAHLQSLTNALLSATLTRVPNTNAPAKPRRDTIDAFMDDAS